MGKKKSCQNVKVPRPLNAVEQELRRTMKLTEDAAAEGDIVLEAAGPSDRLPIRANRDGIIYPFGVRFPFMDFQREVITRCRVAVSQLHLNGWGLLRTFEQVCLHFGFRPTSRLFLYIYDILIPPTGYGFISFRARQGCKLFGIFEESIQEFKWHYFKVLPTPGLRAFWLNDEENPFPSVYWNSEVKDFIVYNLDPLEKAAFNFLVSLPAGLPKKNNFTRRWILDNNDADVGRFLGNAIFLYELAKKSSSKKERSEVVNVEGRRVLRKILMTILGKKRRRKEKGKEEDLVDRVLGEDSAGEHAVNPLDLAFPKEYNYRKTLDGGLTSSFVKKHL
ncbi:hypothetical protein PIB30_009332 [Stylosanthes scabra]|uniref:Uncharacterized protein n=1 Tax=Stylosanthes scabra TaxID=79078 RepID=A0ABU6U437_9FABA|nr:hypothetical protein [Stylosanthes scabra]